MGILATYKNKLYIGSAPMEPGSEMTASDFAAVTWVQVKKTGDLGVIGRGRQAITYDVVDEPIAQTTKGNEKPAAITVECALQPTDPGQIAMAAAADSDLNYPIKYELNDKPSAGASPKNSTRLFVGVVLDSSENFGGTNDVTKQTYSIQRNSNLVKVAASAS